MIRNMDGIQFKKIGICTWKKEVHQNSSAYKNTSEQFVTYITEQVSFGENIPTFLRVQNIVGLTWHYKHNKLVNDLIWYDYKNTSLKAHNL